MFSVRGISPSRTNTNNEIIKIPGLNLLLSYNYFLALQTTCQDEEYASLVYSTPQAEHTPEEWNL